MLKNKVIVCVFAVFAFIVHGVSAATGDQVKRKSVNKGESLTLETPVGKNPFDETKWYFNNILIAEISGDQSKICRDVQCDRRFRDRLKLDHKTGSLTIMDTRTTDAGEYKVEISVSIIRSFSVTVTDPGLSSGAKAGIIAGSVLGALLLGAAVGGGIYYNRNKRSSDVDKENMHGVPYEVLKNDG